MAQRTNRTEKLDLRLTPAAKKTLQAAATAERKSVSEFVLDTALSQAEGMGGFCRCARCAAAPQPAP
jgi:uncharacterized protein (DUF1778 family)